MIDFRYHLVSLVSIFLALAVGIALGAGPLKGTISEGITSQVTTLRQEKADLDSRLKESEKASEQRDEYITASNRQLLTGRLAGQTVALLALPGTDSALLRTTRGTLLAAGAKIGATVQVDQNWTNDAGAPMRDELTAKLTADLGINTKTDPSIPALDKVLARVLQPTSQGTPAPAKVASVIQDLQDAQLITVEGNAVSPASQVVVLAGQVDTGDATRNTDTATAYAALAAAMDRAGQGAVVVSAVASGAKGQSVVLALRQNQTLGRGVSTIDDAGLPMGQASVVLALVEQASGGSGDYGLADGASAAFPDLVGS